MDSAAGEALERPALQRLLDEIEADRINHVVVYTVDRLTRKLFDLHRILERFERHGVVLSVVADPHSGETAAGRLMMWQRSPDRQCEISACRVA